MVSNPVITRVGAVEMADVMVPIRSGRAIYYRVEISIDTSYFSVHIEYRAECLIGRIINSLFSGCTEKLLIDSLSVCCSQVNLIPFHTLAG